MDEYVVYQQVNKDHAYWSEKRRFGQLTGGHTAGLLTHVVDGETTTALLFDVGLGTINGLHDLPQFRWSSPLTALVTHGHPDHHLELTFLAELWGKRMPNVRRGPLTVYSTATTYHEWLEPVHRWGFTGGNTLNWQSITSDSFSLGIFRVQALEVDHCRGAVIYVVEFGNSIPHRVVIGWDMKTLPDPDRYPMLRNPSLALWEANTWNALSDRTGHTSVVELVECGFLAKVNATLGLNRYGSFIVHYGGQEDPDGPLSDPQLRQRLRTVYPAFADTLGVAERGQAWRFTW